MTSRWVVNASPLIVLAHAGQANLLFALADEIVVPRAVANEIEAGRQDDAARRLLATGRLDIVRVPVVPAEIIAWDLGAGETAVLAYAHLTPGWTAVIDDGAARRCARSFLIPHQGTLAVVLQAKKQGIIPSAAEVMRTLRSQGFRLSDAVVSEALRKTVGEAWP